MLLIRTTRTAITTKRIVQKHKSYSSRTVNYWSNFHHNRFQAHGTRDSNSNTRFQAHPLSSFNITHCSLSSLVRPSKRYGHDFCNRRRLMEVVGVKAYLQDAHPQEAQPQPEAQLPSYCQLSPLHLRQKSLQAVAQEQLGMLIDFLKFGCGLSVCLFVLSRALMIRVQSRKAESFIHQLLTSRRPNPPPYSINPLPIRRFSNISSVIRHGIKLCQVSRGEAKFIPMRRARNGKPCNQHSISIIWLAYRGRS